MEKMKHIQESIIGRKGTNSTKLWLLYPTYLDYQDANRIIPKQCKVHCESVILFCVDRQQLKEYFFYTRGFKEHTSALFEVNPRYLKSIEEVEKWAAWQSEISNLYNAKELNEIMAANIPEYIESL